MKQILGCKINDDNIAWSIIEKTDEQKKLINSGVFVFNKGMLTTKSGEVSPAAQRNEHKRARVSKYRTKQRKLKVLNLLSQYGFCPPLSQHELDQWKYKKQYPKDNRAFIEWLYINHKQDQSKLINPYYFRNLAASIKLDMTDQASRYMLGRAFYHITQRRGYLSNRLINNDSEGVVFESIRKITNKKNTLTLGQYFYQKNCNDEKIRGLHTSRTEHYEKEFNIICDKQKLPEEIRKDLYNAIFYQAPNKIKKISVGHCPFETKKYRCAISHPIYEDFRRLQTINNIKIRRPGEDILTSLTNEEKALINPLFYRKSKNNFDFEDIAKKLAPKNKYKSINDANITNDDWCFNYHMNQMISGCPVSAYLKDIFGDQFLNVSIPYQREDKSFCLYTISDIWNILKTFKDEENLIDFASNKLKLDAGQIESLLRIKLPSGYAAISQLAISKILIYLRKGYNYAHAVFMANVIKTIPKNIAASEKKMKMIDEEIKSIIDNFTDDNLKLKIINNLISYNKKNNFTYSTESLELYQLELRSQLIDRYGDDKWNSLTLYDQEMICEEIYVLFIKQMQANKGTGSYLQMETLDSRIKKHLQNKYKATKTHLLYHPSLRQNNNVDPNNINAFKLASSDIIPLDNPIFNKSAHKLENLINRLLDNSLIFWDTEIHITVSEKLRNANERAAIDILNRENNKIIDNATKDLKKLFKKHEIYDVITQNDILKYILWQEQNHKCPYTDQNIVFEDIFGTSAKFDLDYIIPVSITFDRSKSNLVLANKLFSANIKKNQLLGQIIDKKALQQRFSYLSKNIFKLKNEINRLNKSSHADIHPDIKKNTIIKKHLSRTRKNYLETKYYRLTCSKINDKKKFYLRFDDSLSSKFLTTYIQSSFQKVTALNPKITELLKHYWGINWNDDRTSRYSYQIIDSLIAASFEYDTLNQLEDYLIKTEYGLSNISFPLPWIRFIRDTNNIIDQVIPLFDKPKELLKPSKKAMRINGKLVRNKKGEKIYQRCDTVRGSLNKATFYGACLYKNPEDGTETIKYTVRKDVLQMNDKDINNIIDPVIRDIVIRGKEREEVYRHNITGLKLKIRHATDEEKDSIRKQIDSLENDIVQLYRVTNNDRQIVFKKARIFASHVRYPIKLKKHMFESAHEHKKYIYVTNEGNYSMGIYQKHNKKKDKYIRDYTLVNNITAVKLFNEVKDKNKFQLFPDIKEYKNETLSKIAEIRNGNIILFYQDHPDELWNLNAKQLKERMYRVVGLSDAVSLGKYRMATITLKHIDETRPTTQLNMTCGAFTVKDGIVPLRKISQNQFNALVLGQHFILFNDGKIESIYKDYLKLLNS